MHPSVDQEATVNGRTAGLPTGWARPGQLGFRKVKPAKIRGKAAERQRRSASHALVDRIGLAALDVAAARAEVDRPARDTLSKHAAKAWKAAKLSPITLHECRHTFASMMIAAGVNAKALSRYMGHHSIVITLDLYGHLMPGNEDEAAGMLDAYLQRADTAARVAQLDTA